MLILDWSESNNSRSTLGEMPSSSKGVPNLRGFIAVDTDEPDSCDELRERRTKRIESCCELDWAGAPGAAELSLDISNR